MGAFVKCELVSFESAQAMIARDPELSRALDKVGQLDFTMLKRKMIEEHGWTAEFCDEAESLYRQFLALNARYPSIRVNGWFGCNRL